MQPSDSDIRREHYVYFQRIATRWMDNDIYGHVNNVTYYSYFDTVANQYLIERGGLDIANDPVVGFVVASSCQYLAPLTYPEPIDAGFRVNRLGNRSVEYGIGIFPADADRAAAFGTFTHVFVDRAANKSVAIPPRVRVALSAAVVPAADMGETGQA